MTNSSVSGIFKLAFGYSLTCAINQTPAGKCKQLSPYRLLGMIFLYLFSAFLIPLFAENGTVSAFEFIERIFKSVFSKDISEIEALQSGLLEKNPDGKYHLDWPLSRGAAAKTVSRFLNSIKNAKAAPGFFKDIELCSPLYSTLAHVGGLFTPYEKDLFKPDLLITPEETKQILNKLLSLLPENPRFISKKTAECASETVQVIPEFDGTAAFQASDSFSFKGRDSPRASSDSQRISRLVNFVPSNQLAPQYSFDLQEAAKSLDELDVNLNSFEISVFDLSTLEPVEKSDVKELREGLTGIRSAIVPMIEKLEFSRKHLSAALFTDSESIKTSADLKHRLDSNLARMKRLLQKIDSRLGKLPKEEKTE